MNKKLNNLIDLIHVLCDQLDTSEARIKITTNGNRITISGFNNATWNIIALALCDVLDKQTYKIYRSYKKHIVTIKVTE